MYLTLERLFDLNPQIKWPNDVILDDKKICGILTETQKNKNGDTIIIGIGINYSTDLVLFPDDVKETAGSLRSYTKNISKNKYIVELIKTLNDLRTSFTKSQYFSEYKKKNEFIWKRYINNG